MIIAMKTSLLSTEDDHTYNIMIIPYFTYDRLRIQTNMYECDRFLIKRRNDVVGIKIQLMQEIFMN